MTPALDTNKLASLINQTPKAKFIRDHDAVTAHNAMLERPMFDRSIETALLQYQLQVLNNSDGNPNSALAGYYRILGAAEFIQTLRNLALATAPMPRAVEGQLDHRA